MKKTGRIVGKVIYADGDGAQQTMPVGPCEIEETSLDATISWKDGEMDAVTALPLETFATYVEDGSIELTESS